MFNLRDLYWKLWFWPVFAYIILARHSQGCIKLLPNKFAKHKYEKSVKKRSAETDPEPHIYIYRCIRVPPNGYEEFISTISNMNLWIWFFQPDASGHTLADSPLILRSIRTCLVDHGCAWSTSSSDVVSFYVSCFEVLYFLLSTFFAGSIHPTAGLDKRVRCCPVWSYGDGVWK